MQELLKKNQVQIAIILIMAFLTYVLMYPSDILFFKRLSAHGIQIMLVFVLVGLVFLLLKVPRLTLVSFFCVAILSLFFKSSTNATIYRPTRNFSPTFQLAYIKTSELDDTYAEYIKSDLVSKNDIILVQEYTPLWKQLLDSLLAEEYPYKSELLRIDDFGQAIYSKNPIELTDTIGVDGIPSLMSEIKISDEFIYSVVGFYSFPPVHSRAFNELHDRLEELAEYLERLPNRNQVVIGAFNLVPWSEELTSFKQRLHMTESRINSSANVISRTSTLFKQPVDHIFISQPLDCLNFGPLNGIDENEGLYGRYQFKIKEL